MQKSFQKLSLSICIAIFVMSLPTFADSPIRTKAIEDRAEQRINLYRQKFGTKNARLANALQQMWGFHGDREMLYKDKHLVDEWLEIYPKMPALDQRYCARHALYKARELSTIWGGRHFYQPSVEQLERRELGVKIARCVLNAINAPGAEWTPEKSLTEELKLAAEGSLYPEDMKQQARAALSQ
ncbi:MAG: hypothetical protein C0507_23020 [Cyanobacteria bacterium PR.3.49]|nr:hypothetical protein [Cyanobacteria bacterium PR.3.49]